MQPNSTFNSLDVAKLVASFLVVAIHATPVAGAASTVLIGVFARMAVPFFFVVSAFFFFRKETDVAKLKHYLGRMAWLYVFWLVVGLPLVIDRSFVHHAGGLGADLLIFARNLLLNSTFRGSWFIMALMLAIPLVYFLSRRLSTWWVLLPGLCCYVPLTLLSNYYHYLPVQGRNAFDWLFSHLGYIHNSFLVAIVFCALGKLIAEHEERLRRVSRGWLIVALGLVIVASIVEVLSHRAYFGDLYFMLLPATVVLMLSLLRCEIKLPWNYALMRNQSTITYFAHFSVIYYLTGATNACHVTWGTYLLILTLCYFLTLAMRWLSQLPHLGRLKRAF